MSSRSTCLILGAAALLLSAPAAAQGQQPNRQPPRICQEQPEFRQFDFWVGTWAVFSNANGNRAGTNTIESMHDGCVLVETWQSAGGGGGTSMNYYDSVDGQWHQVWVASNYSIDIVGGLDEEGRMVLEGELHNYRLGRSFDFRGTWTPMENGHVRQLFEQVDPESGEWRVWFDGRYERIDDEGMDGGR